MSHGGLDGGGSSHGPLNRRSLSRGPRGSGPEGGATCGVPPSDLVTVGRIVGPHGVKGEVRILPLSDFPERFSEPRDVLLTRSGEVVTQVRVEGARPHKGFLIARVEGVNSRDAALALKGCLIEVAKAHLPELPDGRHYVFDVVGLPVYNEAGGLLGKVGQVITLPRGANDVYVVVPEEGGELKKELLLPATREAVKSIEPGTRLVVRLLPGLEDEG